MTEAKGKGKGVEFLKDILEQVPVMEEMLGLLNPDDAAPPQVTSSGYSPYSSPKPPACPPPMHLLTDPEPLKDFDPFWTPFRNVARAGADSAPADPAPADPSQADSAPVAHQTPQPPTHPPPLDVLREHDPEFIDALIDTMADSPPSPQLQPDSQHSMVPPPSPLLFTTNPAVSMSDEAATAVLDQLCNTALPQDNSRLFA